MDRWWLQGALGDALHALSCSTGYNIRWLMRAIVRLAAKRSFCALFELVLWVRDGTVSSSGTVISALRALRVAAAKLTGLHLPATRAVISVG